MGQFEVSNESMDEVSAGYEPIYPPAMKRGL